MTPEPTDSSAIPATRADPLLGHLSDRLGGPAGSRMRPRLRPAPVLLGLTVVAILLSVLTTQYCRINGWGGVEVYHAGCYSDISALYGQRGLAEDPWGPVSGSGYFEYPVLTSVVASVLAWLTGRLAGLDLPDALVWWEGRTSLLHWDLTFAAAAVLWLVLVLVVMKAAGRRPWDAALVAFSPAIIFGIGINWDIWAVTALGLAVLAFTRGAHVTAGLMIGIGVSFKLFPLFMLGAVLVLALRRDAGLGPAVFLRTLAGAVVSWLVLNVPAMLISFSAWSQFFELSAERGAGYSSPWHIWGLIAESWGADPLAAETISWWSFGLFAASCAGVLALGLLAPTPPRMVQLLFLIVAAFLLVNKVYSPQFMIWLVPLIALAAPRVRDALIWQGFELLHFWAVWMYLASLAGDHQPQHQLDSALYVAAVLGHMGATIYLMVQVVLDVLHPRRDPVRQARPALPSPTGRPSQPAEAGGPAEEPSPAERLTPESRPSP